MLNIDKSNFKEINESDKDFQSFLNGYDFQVIVDTILTLESSDEYTSTSIDEISIDDDGNLIFEKSVIRKKSDGLYTVEKLFPFTNKIDATKSFSVYFEDGDKMYFDGYMEVV
jgi:hypothetical protein